MKEVKHVGGAAIALAVGLFLIAASGTPVFSQVAGIDRSDSLEILKNKALTKSDPQRVVRAIEEVTVPYRARPITSTEPIPAEVVSALVGLLDFERPHGRDPMFDISAGQRIYPVMRSLVEMRGPVLPALVEVVEAEDAESVRSKNAVALIRRVLGDDVKASDYLRIQASASKSEGGKERLLSAADKVADDRQKFQNRVEN